MMCPLAVFLNHRIQNIVLEQGYEIEMSLNVMMSFAFQMHFLHFYDWNFIKLIMINIQNLIASVRIDRDSGNLHITAENISKTS